MFALVFSLVSLGLILLVFTYFQRRNKVDETEVVVQIDEECCGAHDVCDKDSLLNSDPNAVYYDDEDLDVLIGVAPINYTNDQLKQLYDVFYTLKESDVAGWLRSLQARSIQIPLELRDEALMVVSERRTG